MKIRIVLGVLALLIGAGLVAFTVNAKGAPWGFRDRAGVLVEVVGAVELTAVPQHRGATAGATLRGADVTGLFLGDEIRTGPLSMARVKTPDISFRMGSGSQLRLDDDGGMTLERGSLTLDVPRSDRTVRMRGGGGEVAFDEGAFDLVADCRAGNLFVLARRGKATAIAKDESTDVTSGQLLQLNAGTPSVGAPATEVNLVVNCQRGAGEGKSRPREVSGQAPQGTFLLVDGSVLYPANDATFKVRLPPDDVPVVVFARAPGGASTEKSINCGR